MPSFRSLARNRDFTVLWVAATISELGLRASSFVMPLVAYALTGSTLWAAVAEALFLGGLVVMLLPAGVIADRRNRQGVMAAAMGASALAYASLAGAGVFGQVTLAHLLAVCVVAGVGSGLFTPAETSAIRTVVPADELPTAMSQLQARQHVASLLGGPVGGALLGVGRWFPFAASAVAHAAGWWMVLRMRADLSPSRTRSAARPLADLRSGLVFVWRRPLFRTLLIANPMINLTLNAVFFVAILRLVEEGFAPWSIGLAEAGMGISGIAGALVAPWLIDRVPTGRLMVFSSWVFVPLTIPLALWTHPVVLAAVAAAGIFFNPAGNAGISSYRMAVTPPELIGRVQSALQFASMAAMPLAPIVGGLALGALGGRSAMLLLGGLAALAALIPTLAPSVRSVPRPDRWQRWEPEPAVAAAYPSR